MSRARQTGRGPRSDHTWTQKREPGDKERAAATAARRWISRRVHERQGGGAGRGGCAGKRQGTGGTGEGRQRGDGEGRRTNTDRGAVGTTEGGRGRHTRQDTRRSPHAGRADVMGRSTRTMKKQETHAVRRAGRAGKWTDPKERRRGAEKETDASTAEEENRDGGRRRSTPRRWTGSGGCTNGSAGERLAASLNTEDGARSSNDAVSQKTGARGTASAAGADHTRGGSRGRMEGEGVHVGGEGQSPGREGSPTEADWQSDVVIQVLPAWDTNCHLRLGVGRHPCGWGKQGMVQCPVTN